MTAKRRGLAGRRKAVGYTQEQLAALLGVERSTVVRWEAGETEPVPWCRPKLAAALAVSLDALQGMLTTPDGLPAQPHDELLLSVLGELTPAEVGTLMERFAAMDIASRREVLQELAIISGAILSQPVRRWLAHALAVVPLVSPESADSDALDALERAAMVFRRWDASGVGGLRRKAVVGQLNAVSIQLPAARCL
jgi:transcriptional regulator with XRE-family HTH domain